MSFDTSHIAGATSKIVKVKAITISTGLPYTGGAYNTATISATYTRDGATATTLTLVTATAGTYTSSGFVHAGKGVYEIGAPTAALAAGADGVIFSVDGIADVLFSNTRVELTGVDPRSSAAVSADVTKWNGTTVATPDTAGYPKVTIKSGTGVGEIATSSGAVSNVTTTATATAVTTVNGLAAGVITATSIATDAITAGKIAADAIGASELAADAVTEIAAGVLSAATTTPIAADIKKIATQTASAAAGVTFPSSIASPTNITAATGVVLSGVTHTGAVIPTVTTVNGLAANVITAAATASDFGTEIANAVVEAEITALMTYNRSADTTASITGPVSGVNGLTVTTDATYNPIKTL